MSTPTHRPPPRTPTGRFRRAAPALFALGPCGVWLVLGCSSAPPEQSARRGPATQRAAAAEPTPLSEPEAPAAIPRTDCPLGFGDCDGDADNGCERPLADADHCGACGHACEQGQGCRAGACAGGVVEVAAGGSHSCARTADGGLLCWGLGGVGQLGPPHGTARLSPEPVALTRPAHQVVTGRYFTCVRYGDGTAACFGDGGLLGSDRPTPSAVPQGVIELDDALALSASANHTCALRASGYLLCWGGNAAGQLGDGQTTEFSLLPVLVTAVDDAIGVVAGNAHTCMLAADRSVRCWGLNRYGQLGDGTTESRPSPVQVVGLTDVAELSAGEFHTCARVRTGELYCWGRNQHGQLGEGGFDDRPVPYPVALDRVAAVDAGERHTCAVQEQGQLWCWGDNEAGQLGLGDELGRASPTQVPMAVPVASVSAGESHTCALTRDGAVYCFGLNDGQLGDGSTRSRNRPVRVLPLPTAQTDQADHMGHTDQVGPRRSPGDGRQSVQRMAAGDQHGRGPQDD